MPSPGAHPPPLPGAPGFDETYRWLVDGLPARLRQPAERLPWTLGLTQSPDGRWSDFVHLHPNRQLPLYAAQAPDGELGVTAVQLNPLPARPPPRRLRLAGAGSHRRRAGRGRRSAPLSWPKFRAALARGDRRGHGGRPAGGCALPPRHGALGTGDARGTERAGGRFSAGADLRGIVREKLGWIGAPAQALLQATGDRRRVNAFLHAHDLYLVGLQAIDDVIDMDEDRALRGADVPERVALLGGGAGAGGAKARAAGRCEGRNRQASPGSRRGSTPSRTRLLLAPGRRRPERRARLHRHRRRDRGRDHARRGPSRRLGCGRASGRARLSAAVGYQRELEWNEPPSPDERRYARWTVVRAAGAPAASWWPLARIGAVDLYLAPPGSEQEAPSLSVTRLIAGKRGRRGSGDYVGVDGEVQTDSFEIASRRGRAAPVRTRFRRRRSARTPSASRWWMSSFDKLAALPGRSKGRFASACPATTARRWRGRRSARATGRRWRASCWRSVRARASACSRFRAWPGAARPYLAPADLAAAVAAAVGDWQADVVLIAMSDGAWGTPRYLRDVLREAARCGRGGRGTSIFCSVGDPSRNHVRQDDSAALGADDLASQPWVHAIAACDSQGGWYRVYPGYECPGNDADRRSPAPGAARERERRDLQPPGPGGRAGGAGRAQPLERAHRGRRFQPGLRRGGGRRRARAPERTATLSAAELRALLALTADVPGADRRRARASRQARSTHAIGSGTASRSATAWSTRGPRAWRPPIPSASRCWRRARCPRAEINRRALALARAWQLGVRRAARRPDPLARAYLRLAGRVSRLFLTSLSGTGGAVLARAPRPGAVGRRPLGLLAGSRSRGAHRAHPPCLRDHPGSARPRRRRHAGRVAASWKRRSVTPLPGRPSVRSWQPPSALVI